MYNKALRRGRAPLRFDLLVMKYFFVVFVFLVWFSSPASAQQSAKLYETEVIVDSQDRGERASAINSAFYRVLVKITGRPKAELMAHFSAKKLNPSQYLQQFRYRDITPAELNEHITSLNAQVLWVAFDSNSLNKLIFSENIAFWGKVRPTILVWLAVEDGSDRYLLTRENNFDITEALLAGGRERGLTLRLPVMDAEDRRNIQFADVWGDFGTTVLEASERYQAGAVLSGRLYRTVTNALAVKWTFYHPEGVERWQHHGDPIDRQLVYTSGVHHVADYLSEQFSEVLSEHAGTEVVLDVAAVHGVTDYAKVLEHLREFETVADVRIARLSGRTARYELQLRGTVEGLKKVIMLGEVLEEVKSDPIGFRIEDVSAASPLQYHLIQ